MLKFFVRRRFNYVDIIVSSVGSMFVIENHYVLAPVVFFLGSLASVVLEMVHDKREAENSGGR